MPLTRWIRMKRKECFLEGMSPKLRSHLGRHFEDFNQLIDDAIAMEEDLHLHHLEKKRSRCIVGPTGGVPQRPRLTYQMPPRPSYQQPRHQPLMIQPAHQQFVQRPQYCGYVGLGGDWGLSPKPCGYVGIPIPKWF